jgi:hypothetical protein
MASDKSKQTAEGPVHELAGGWITERTGTPVPLFLKLAYVGFSLFGLYYLFGYARGETDHATRGALVRGFNDAVQPPGMGWIVFLAAVLLVYVGGLWWYAFAAKEQEPEREEGGE